MDRLAARAVRSTSGRSRRSGSTGGAIFVANSQWAEKLSRRGTVSSGGRLEKANTGDAYLHSAHGNVTACCVLYPPRAGAGQDLHNATIQPKRRDRAVSSTWCMPESSRSGRMPSRVALSRSPPGRRDRGAGGGQRMPARVAARRTQANAHALPQPAVHTCRRAPPPSQTRRSLVCDRRHREARILRRRLRMTARRVPGG
jgi:hypothetical protein